MRVLARPSEITPPPDVVGGPDAPSTRLLSDASLSAFGALGSTGLAGFASILITRGLTVASRGQWAVIASLGTIVATIVATGLPAASAYAAATLTGRERVRIVQAAVTASAAFAALSTLAFLAAAAILRPAASTTAVVIASLIPAATVWYTVAQRLALTLAPMRTFAAAQVLGAVTTLGAVAVLSATQGLTVLSVALASLAGTLVGGAVSVAALRYSQSDRGLLIALAPALRILRPYLGYALMTFLTLSLTQIVQRVDVLLISGYRGSRQAAHYAVAVQVTDLLLVLPAALGLVMFRRGARSTNAHFADALVMVRWTGAFAVLSAIGVLALGGRAVPFIFGSSYAHSVVALRLLLPGTVAFAVQSVLSEYLASRGRPRIVLVAWLVGAVVGIVADLVLIPAYGIAGAAFVSSASYIIVTGLHIPAFRKLKASAL